MIGLALQNYGPTTNFRGVLLVDRNGDDTIAHQTNDHLRRQLRDMLQSISLGK